MKKFNALSSGKIVSHIIPVIVWLAVLAGTIVLFKYKSQRFEAVGIVYGEERRIAATVAGRIKSVNYRLFDKVNPGDVVAVVDTVLDRKSLELDIEAKRNVILAKIKQLLAQLDETRNKMESEQSAKKDNLNRTARNYYLDLDDAKFRVAELKSKIEPIKIKQKEIELEIKSQALAASSPALTTQKRIEISYEQERLKTQIEALAKQIEENQKLLLAADENQKLAEQRLKTFIADSNQTINPSIAIALKPIEEEINVQYKAIDQLLVQSPELEIRSPFRGIVSDIRRSMGEAIVEREPILTIVEYEPAYIVAYIGEDQLGQIKENMQLEIYKRSYPQKTAAAYVKQLGPVMEAVPNRLWPNTNVPLWGRPVMISIPDGMKDLLPGELVSIRGLSSSPSTKEMIPSTSSGQVMRNEK
jgi:multidrug resistance efflux pump